MKKNRFIIGLFFLFVFGNSTYAQCDTFAHKLLHIIKTESYSDFNNYLQPPDEMIKILHWEANDSAYAFLNEFNNLLYNSLIQNVKDIRDSISNKSLDINTMRYVDCYSTYGIISEKKIRFTIDGVLDSLNAFTIETSNIYISKDLEYHRELEFLPSGNYDVDSDDLTNSVKPFTPRQEELDLGIKLLEEYLMTNSIEYNSYRFVLGFQNEFNKPIFRYIVFMNESKIKLLDLDLEKKTWVEIISE